MKFSVGICTWNRAELLEQTLQSFCNLGTDNFDWEIVVVDNNSTDHTPAVCQSFETRLPIRRVLEKQQGHSNARNRVIAESGGDFIAWTDDDVIVDPNWLSAYDIAIKQHQTATFFGGKIIPRFESSPPVWVTRNWKICSGLFAERDLGDQQFQFDSKRLPYGANFVTRRAIQLDFLFRSEFGRKGEEVRGFDEIDVLNRLLDANHEGWWVPDSKLDHVIPDSRVTLDYVRDYFRGQGQTFITREISKPEPSQLRRDIRKTKTRFRLSRFRSSKVWFPLLVQLNNLEGQLQQIMLRES